jgi:superfamily II DNA or RNA helicase
VKLRYYQTALYAEVCNQWSLGYRNVMVMATTGAGKTPVIGEAIRNHRGAACVIAHRDNLVLQLSRMLASLGIRHRVIASTKTQRAISADHVKRFKQVFLDPNSRVAVASAQTLAKRDELATWCASVTLWVVDEAHHACKGTIWGKCLERFTHPQCCGLLPTATPGRADGKGLGSHHDGYADVMVALVEDGDRLGVQVAYPGQSVTCAPAKVLIKDGYLSPYKVACVESHITEFLGEVAASGDWSQAQLKSAAEQSSVIGDVVTSYRQFSDGRTGITFATDVETAGNIAKAYRAAGISAEVLTGETPIEVRNAIFDRLERRVLQQVVAVDVISEGTDIPAIDDLCLARPTASLGLLLQMIGRGLRMAPGKTHLQIRDHVGNFLRHRGGPDTPRTWSLDRRDKRAPKERDAIPIRVCLNVACGQPYERHLDACPFCGEPAPGPAERGPPEMVDGVLALMDDETLARLRGDIAEIDVTPEDYEARMLATGLPPRFARANRNKHMAKQEAQAKLREVMAQWGGYRKAEGMSDTEMQRLFHMTFGVDVMTARGLGIEAATRLTEAVLTGNFIRPHARGSGQ